MGELSSDYDFAVNPHWGVIPIRCMPRQPLRAERVCIDAGHHSYYEWMVTMPDGTVLHLNDAEFVTGFVQKP